MRLVSCYIENYGQLSGKKIDFDCGITEFCLGNGVGKTTLASFIEAMFYGMETRRDNSKEFGDREHFYPFRGGKFGGSIEFEFGGKNYKTERFFDEKSETNDSLKVYRDGVLTDELGENIGEKVFDLDKKSFERVLFVSSADVEIASTGNINTKLANVVEGSADDSVFENAIAWLKKREGDYFRLRKECPISNEKNLLKEKRSQLDNFQKTADTLPQKLEDLAKTEAEFKQLDSQILSAQTQNVVFENWETYDRMLSESRDLERQLQLLIERFPKGLCDENELNEAKRLLNEAEVLKGKSEQKTFSEGDADALDALSEEFRNGVPTEEELKAQETKVKQLSELTARISALSERKLSQNEIKLNQKFAARAPSREEEENLQKVNAELRQTEEALARRDARQSVATATNKRGVPHRNLYIAVAVLGILLAIAGVAVLSVFEKSTILGAALCVVGGICALASGFLYLNKKSSTMQETPIDLEKIKLAAQKEALETRMDAILEKFGYSTQNGAEFAVRSFQKDIEEFEALREREEAIAREINSTRAKISVINSDLQIFFGKFGLAGDEFFSMLSDLRKDAASFVDLRRRQNESRLNLSKLQNQLAENTGRLADFCEKYGLKEATADEFKRFEDALTQSRTLNDNIRQSRTKAEKFKAEKSLFGRPVLQKVDLVALNEQKNEVNNRRNILLAETENCERATEKVDELSAEIAQSAERLADYQKTYDLLKRTEDFLTLAEKNLKDKYIKPIKDSFGDYATILEESFGKKITVTRDLKIGFEQNGVNHDERFLSAGQRSICALCFRLALSDNMYSDEKPFLILDDPFVQLDAEHFAKCRDVIKKISEKHQIVYFTCHESRKISSGNFNY